MESGSQEVRDIVNKKLCTDEIITAAKIAEAEGLQSLKMYSMVGIPGEDIIGRESSIQATLEMLKSVKSAAPSLKISLGISTFVPKVTQTTVNSQFSFSNTHTHIYIYIYINSSIE